MRFDRWDICAAYNLYSQLWGWDEYTHGIQARLSRLNYRPADSEQDLLTVNDNTRAIYQELVKRLHQTISGYVECECCGDPCMGTLMVGRMGQVSIGGDTCELCQQADCMGGECYAKPHQEER